jgi:phosphohistidine phosphatase
VDAGMELILWRHAEAVDGTPDHSRALTDKGLRQAEHMANFLSPRLPSNTRILVSPALRAQQTASALTKKFTTEPAINIDVSPEDVLVAAGWPSANGTTLLVGHQPWLGQVAALLMTGSADYWSVKKGSIWWFKHRESDDQTTLRLVIAPEQL